MADPLRFPAPPMPGPVRRAALGPAVATLQDAPEGLRLREVPFPALLAVRGKPGEDLNAALGFDLPVAPNTVRRAGDVSVLWLGPTEWLIVAPSGQEEELYRKILDKLPRAAALTDVTDSRMVLELSGPLVREVLAKGCPIDLHANAFPPGRCAQTLLGQVPALIECLDEAPTYRLFVRPSVARFFVSWLLDAAAEY